MRMTAQVLDTKAAQGKPYFTPTEYVDQYNEKLRKQKDDERLLLEKILRENVETAASDEKRAALVFRYLEEKKRVDAQLAKVLFHRRYMTHRKKRRRNSRASRI